MHSDQAHAGPDVPPVLLEHARALLDATTSDHVIEATWQALHALCPASEQALLLRSDDRLDVVRADGQLAEHTGPALAPNGQPGPLSAVLRSGSAVTTSLMKALDGWSAALPAGTDTVDILPMVTPDAAVLGVLLLIGSRDRNEPPDHNVLEELLGYAARALHDTREARSLREQAHELRRLTDATHHITGELSLAETLDRIVERALTVSSSDRGAIYVLDRETDTASCAASRGLSDRYIELVNARYRDLPGGRVLREIAPVVVEDIEALDALAPFREHMLDEGIRSYVVLPLVAHDETIAALVAYRDTPGTFEDTTLRLMRAFADQAALALVRAHEHAAVKVAEARYRSLFDGVPIGIYRSTPDGRFLDANPALLQLLGVEDRDALRKHNARDFYLDPADRRRWQALLDRTGVVRDLESQVVRTDGQVIWVRDNARIVRDAGGDVRFYEGALEDITRQKQAEAALRHAALQRQRLAARLREQAQQVQRILNTVEDGIVTLDAEHRIVMANPAARRILKLLGQEGEVLHALDGVPVEQLLAPRADGLPHELSIEQPTPATYEVVASPVPIKPGEPGWTLILRDVTEAQLLRSRAEEQNRLAAVGQLAAGIAHDFNNITATIILDAELLLASDLSQADRRRAELVLEQAERAADLTRQVLDYSRRTVIEPQPLDLAEFLAELRTMLRRTLPESIRITLTHPPEDDRFPVRADPARLQQVFVNLALNARDAMPNGGELCFTVDHIQTENDAPPVPGMAPGHWVRVRVTDSGTGIHPDALPRVFEPFFTTKEPGAGTGLGLAQVYGIVRQHGGHLDISSQLGAGTTVTLFFQTRTTPADRAHAGEEPRPARGKRETVLLVEDSAAAREALRDTLEQLNYRVLTAEHGAEALERYEQASQSIELVISDLVMPVMGGRALIDALRERDPAVRVIVLTGYPLEAEDHELLEQGAAAWLQKPLDSSTLAAVLREALETPAVPEPR